MLPLSTVTLSRSPVLTSGRRGPRRAVPRVLAIVGGAGIALIVVWLMVMLALWIYAWFRLGGVDLQALDDEAPRLGTEGALAPADAVTVLVVVTEERDPTRLAPPALAGPVVLAQAGGPRDALAVLLLPVEMTAMSDGHEPQTLAEIHADGGIDGLAQAVIDYTQVRVDHVVSFTVEALPRLVDIVGSVEVCLADGCRPTSSEQVRQALRDPDYEQWARLVAAAVRGVSVELGARSVAMSPLAAKRAVDVVADEVHTDVSLRGRRLLHFAEMLAMPMPVTVETIPLLRHPVTGEIVPLDEPALVRFQHLQDGTPFGVRDADEEIARLVLADLRIGVLNGAGVAGLAAQVEADLLAHGLQVVGTGNAPIFDHQTTTVTHTAGDERLAIAAALIADMLNGADVVEADRELRFEGIQVDIVVTAGADRDGES